MFEMFETLNKALENAFLELFFPYIYHWIPGFTGYEHFLKHSKALRELVFETINEHKETRVSGRPRVMIFHLFRILFYIFLIQKCNKMVTFLLKIDLFRKG